VYDEVTTRGGRYVQGGGCTTVGVAGLILGGGFGSFSKAFGLAAASLLEAEIVTADGKVRVVNACREPDLFWALKGGGGGTFGVVTRMTLQTHDLPEKFGSVRFTVRSRSDSAFRRLLERFLAEYASKLFNPHWGEQVRATLDRALDCQMLFSGLSEADADEAWRGMRDFVGASPDDYEIRVPFQVLSLPARHLWDKTYLDRTFAGAATPDERPGARPRDFWWAGDGDQAGTFWHGYYSAWLPASLLDGESRERLAHAWFEASRHWDVSLHFNKGLAGADSATLAQSRETSINPQALSAFALAIIAGEGSPNFPSFEKPDLVVARRRARQIAASMDALKVAAPDAGNYLAECDYFNDNWREANWGGHSERLNRIKQRYDPHRLFIVHHGVGSED
jgi:FAD/FMN-containing dehydrogenase